MINPEGAEKEQRPTSADAGVAKKTIAFVLLEINAAYKKKRGGEVRNPDFAQRPERAEFVDTEESDTHDQNDYAEFVEPVCAESFFNRGYGFHALLKSRPRRRDAICRERRWRGDASGRGRNLRWHLRVRRGNALRRRLGRGRWRSGLQWSSRCRRFCFGWRLRGCGYRRLRL